MREHVIEPCAYDPKRHRPYDDVRHHAGGGLGILLGSVRGWPPLLDDDDLTPWTISIPGTGYSSGESPAELVEFVGRLSRER